MPQVARNDNYCLYPVTGRQADAVLTQVIADPQFQQLQQRLQVQGLNPNLNAAKVYSGPQCALVSVPIGPQANLYYLRTNQGASVTAVTSQGRRRIHLQPDGTTAEVLLLTKDQVHGILAQVSDVLQRHGITTGYVWAAINEVSREVWLTIRDRQALHLAVLEASTWSESGPVIIGGVKYEPVQVSCGTVTRISSKLDAYARPVPLGVDGPLALTPCDGGDNSCGGYTPIYVIIIEIRGDQICEYYCEIRGELLPGMYCRGICRPL